MNLLVGIPTAREYKPFWDSMDVFLPALAKEHKLEVIEVRQRKIDEARNLIADYFLDKQHDFLLFLDDDHHGHTMEMFNALYKPNEFVCSMKSVAKTFPYNPNLMLYSGLTDPRMKYNPIDQRTGYAYCDLVGFGMTLIRRDTFAKLTKPYFVCINNQKEDNYFCDNLIASGVKPLGCFEFLLAHVGISEENVDKLRESEFDVMMKKMFGDDPAKYPTHIQMVT